MTAARARSFAVAAFCAIAMAGLAHGVGAVGVDRPFGADATRVAVKLDDRLSSQDNRAGDVFGFELTSSAIVDGVALGSGVRGHGVVVAVASGAGTKNGFLTLAVRSIDPPDGSHIPVGLATGSLDRVSSRDTNVVYEKGTRFVVVAPPPPAPEPSETP